MTLIESGKGVVIKRGKNLKYICASEEMIQLDPKFQFDCSCMIGKNYGTAFHISDDRDRKLTIIDPVLAEEHADEYLKLKIADVGNETKDNRNIEDHVGDLQNQKLSKEDIMTLQEEGVSGEKIIQELVENSATFNDRTEFSKAKYLKKKKQKYVANFQALKPTARLLCEMYFFKNPLKILDMRPDALAQILTWSDVQAGCNVVVFETTQGLVAGSVLERLGSTGRLIQLYKSSFPVRIIMEQFNYSSTELEKNLCSIQIDKVDMFESLFEAGKTDKEILESMLGQSIFETTFGPPKDQKEAPTLTNVDVVKSGEAPALTNGDVVKSEEAPALMIHSDAVKSEEKAETEVKTDDVEMKSADVTDDKNKNKNLKRKSGSGRDNRDNRDKSKNKQLNFSRVAYISKGQRLKESQIALSHFRSKQIDSLIIASKFHPKAPLLALLKFLPPACPFVVFHQHKEPLMECYVELRDQSLAANVELTESWLRNIQVLPNRTHPDIMMSGSGGYILRGMKVV